MLPKCLFEVIRKELFAKSWFILFLIGVKMWQRSAKGPATQLFHIEGSSILAFKVTVQVKRTLIGPAHSIFRVNQAII